MSDMNITKRPCLRSGQRPAVCLVLFVLMLLSQFAPGAVTRAMAYTTLTPAEVEARLAAGTAGTIIDVRAYETYCTMGHLPCALNYPWTAYLQTHYTELDPGSMFLLVCESGIRSAQAAAFLDGQGFTSVYTMSSGMDAWQGETQTCDVTCPANCTVRNCTLGDDCTVLCGLTGLATQSGANAVCGSG
mgnify:CR=1 FL=1